MLEDGNILQSVLNRVEGVFKNEDAYRDSSTKECEVVEYVGTRSNVYSDHTEKRTLAYQFREVRRPNG